jgi:mannose-6-phosphate isomerase-like protein (cupin superfamily)
MGNIPGRQGSWLEVEMTATIIKPVTVRSNQNHYKSDDLYPVVSGRFLIDAMDNE